MSSEDFKEAFEKLFVIQADGQLPGCTHGQLKAFVDTFAYRMRSSGGMPDVVLSKPSDESQVASRLDVLRTFSSAYPAYYALCRNMQWRMDFAWPEPVPRA
jgi:hypothetical protein